MEATARKANYIKTEALDSEDGYEAMYRRARVAYWDALAHKMDSWTGRGGYYHRRLAQVFQFLVSPGQRVVEIGCARGDLLAALKPGFGVGVDFSGEMIKRASKRHPELHFVQADAHDLGLSEKFDIIILSDLVNDLWDVQRVFQKIVRLATPRTRIILNIYSRMWELPLAAVERLGLAKPTLDQNWLTVEDITGLLKTLSAGPKCCGRMTMSVSRKTGSILGTLTPLAISICCSALPNSI